MRHQLSIVITYPILSYPIQGLIDQLQVDVKQVRPSVEKTRPNTTKNPDVDRLEEDVNRLGKRWGNCCMQVVERLRSCEAACELLEKYNMSYQTETNWMDELVSACVCLHPQGGPTGSCAVN